jgi:hypothetical protein
LTSVLVGGEWSALRPGRFNPGEGAPGTHWTGGWVGPRTGLDNVEKRKFLTLPGLELRPLGLYRLRCPDPSVYTYVVYEVGHERASSLLFQRRLDCLFVLFVGDGVKPVLTCHSIRCRFGKETGR